MASGLALLYLARLHPLPRRMAHSVIEAACWHVVAHPMEPGAVSCRLIVKTYKNRMAQDMQPATTVPDTFQLSTCSLHF